MIRRLQQSLRHRLVSLAGYARLHRLAGALAYPGREFAGAGPDIRTARSILVVKPDEIGDVVLATGFLRSLRRQCPQARITLAVRPLCAELVRDPVFGDEIVLWDDAWRGLRLEPRVMGRLVRTAWRRWHSAPPDWAIVPRGGGDHVNAAFYAWWSGARQICAHESFCTDWGLRRAALVNRIIPSPGVAHEIEFHRRMLTALGLDSSAVQPALSISAAARTEAGIFWEGTGLTAGAVALGIGASGADKCWPLENFRALTAELRSRWPKLGVVIVGGPEEQAVGEGLKIALGEGTCNAAGKLSVLGTAALLERCNLYVGNDSGPAHLAAAMGCAVITITKHPLGGDPRSPYAPARFGPVARWSRILQPKPLEPACQNECARQQAHCITGVRAEEAIRAIEAAAREGAFSPPA
ncbi:MAG TPA: glycosyltransferase family 9 protein [Verrucomicrobiae bacterium]|nr:glycosyltransferase family 9 protein [Verrucomicrobiae bacterium]